MIVKQPCVLDLAYNNVDAQNWPPNWPMINNLPAAVICKASEFVEDPTFGANWVGLWYRQVARGTYHFYRAANTSAHNADIFLKALSNNGWVEPGDVLVLDAEEEGRMSITAMVDWTGLVHDATGILPIWYSRPSLLNPLNFNKLNSAQKALVKTIKIWVAGGPTNPENVDKYPTPQSFGLVPDQNRYGPVVLWQYRGEYPSDQAGFPEIPGGLDLNWVDPDFLKQWQLETGAVVTPPTPPDDPGTGGTMISATVGTNGLNFRNAPVSGTAMPPQLQAGQIVEGDLITPDNWLHVLKVDGVARVGYVAAWYLTNIVNNDPTPEPTPVKPAYITAHYDDGSDEKFIPG